MVTIMARSRNIKPGLFDNEVLGEADPIYTVLFAGLWTLADKEGRLEDRPARIRKQILGYRNIDPCLLLAWLNDESFINRYTINGNKYIQILNWEKHQNPHHKEAKSTIPKFIEFDKDQKIECNHKDSHAQAKHDSSMDHERIKESASSPLIPDSLNLIPDSLNLIPDSLNLIPSGTTNVDSNASKGKRFVKPEIKEVSDYFCSKGSSIDESEKFFNYYESNGWKVGKNSMKNWKAAASNWAKNNYSQKPQGQINKDDTSWANNMQAPYLPNQPKALGHE